MAWQAEHRLVTCATCKKKKAGEEVTLSLSLSQKRRAWGQGEWEEGIMPSCM